MSLKKLSLPLVFLLALLAGFSSFYFYFQYQKLQKIIQNPTEAVKEETKILVSKVGKLIDLPQGETPTIATITDINQLRDQAFFLKAKNGDKVLLYPIAKKAILYRESENKIIEVAPINLGSTPQSTPSPTLNSSPEFITPSP